MVDTAGSVCLAAFVMLSLGLFRRAATPVLLQTQVAECGFKCLHMVAAYHGHHVDLHSQVTSSQGSSLAELMDQAQRLGLVARGLRAELAELSGVSCPAILHWDLEHFVVLVRLKGRRAVVHDPARGRVVMDLAELSKHFTGVLLELQPGPSFKVKAALPALGMRELIGPARGLISSAGRIGALSLLVQVMLLASPLYMQWVVDEALLSGDAQLLSVLALAFGLLLLLQVGAQYLRDWLVVSIGNALALRLSSNVGEHLLALPMGWFSTRSTGDVFARFRALAPVTSFLAQGVPIVLVDGSMALLTLLMLSLYHWPLMLLVLASSMGYGLIRLLSFAPFRGRVMEQVEAAAHQESHFLETLRGIHSVKAFGQEQSRFARWQQLLGGELNAGIALARFTLNYEALRALLFGMELLLVVYLGAMAVLQRDLTLGMLFAFISYRGHFVRHVCAFIEQWLEFRSLGVNLERLGDICLYERETLFAEQPPALTKAKLEQWQGDLSCRKLSIVAPGTNQLLLRDANLALASGEFVAVIGASGVGKSSLLQVLTGLQAPAAGELWLGQQQLQPQMLREYRQQLGVVRQQDKLFSGSLLDNVTLFAPPTAESNARVQALLSQVGLSELLSDLPMGLATQLSELGSGLSAGQNQRLLIARALYRQPKLLLLDEATANLDVVSVDCIRQLLAELPMTKLVVTHDLSVAQQADRVFELVGQQLVEVRLSQSDHADAHRLNTMGGESAG